MKMFSTWKLLRKIQRIRIRGPFISRMPLAIWTWNIPPPVICLTQVRNRENIPGWIPPSPISCSHTLGHTPAQHIAMLCFVMLCLLYIYCFFPLSSPVDPETDAAPVIDYVDDDPSLPEQPGKPPLWSSRYRPFHSLMLALDFAIVIVCSYSDA